MKRELIYRLYKESYDGIPESHIVEIVNQHFDKLSEENVKKIGIKYSNQHLNENDIKEIEEICRSIQSEFRGNNMSGKATASFFDPSWTEIYLNPEIVKAILIGVGSNAIFQLILTVFKKVNGKTITYLRGSKEINQKAKLKIKVNDKEGRELNFYLEDKLSEELKIQALEKIEEFLKSNSDSETLPLKSDFLYTEEQWNSVNLLEKMKENVEKQKIKEK